MHDKSNISIFFCSFSAVLDYLMSQEVVAKASKHIGTTDLILTAVSFYKKCLEPCLSELHLRESEKKILHPVEVLYLVNFVFIKYGMRQNYSKNSIRKQTELTVHLL